MQRPKEAALQLFGTRKPQRKDIWFSIDAIDETNLRLNDPKHIESFKQKQLDVRLKEIFRSRLGKLVDDWRLEVGTLVDDYYGPLYLFNAAREAHANKADFIEFMKTHPFPWDSYEDVRIHLTLLVACVFELDKTTYSELLPVKNMEEIKSKLYDPLIAAMNQVNSMTSVTKLEMQECGTIAIHRDLVDLDKIFGPESDKNDYRSTQCGM